VLSVVKENRHSFIARTLELPGYAVEFLEKLPCREVLFPTLKAGQPGFQFNLEIEWAGSSENAGKSRRVGGSPTSKKRAHNILFHT